MRWRLRHGIDVAELLPGGVPEADDLVFIATGDEAACAPGESGAGFIVAGREIGGFRLAAFGDADFSFVQAGCQLLAVRAEGEGIREQGFGKDVFVAFELSGVIEDGAAAFFGGSACFGRGAADSAR